MMNFFKLARPLTARFLRGSKTKREAPKKTNGDGNSHSGDWISR